MQLADTTNVLTYIARHGETILNATNCYRGSANPALNEKGIGQANVLSELLKHIELSHIFCSDKIRAVHTAKIIGRGDKTPVHQTENLRALDVGDFSGQKKTPENEAVVDGCSANPDVPIPGGESFNQFRSRIHPCFEEAVDLAMRAGVPTLLVAHSSIVREAGNWIRGDHKAVLVKPGGLIAVYVKDGKLAVDSIFRPLVLKKGQRSELS